VGDAGERTADVGWIENGPSGGRVAGDRAGARRCHLAASFPASQDGSLKGGCSQGSTVSAGGRSPTAADHDTQTGHDEHLDDHRC
jgi:hypothetical protein